MSYTTLSTTLPPSTTSIEDESPIQAAENPSDYKVALVAGAVFTLLAVIAVMGYHHISGFEWVCTIFQNDTGLLAMSVAFGTAGVASSLAGIYLLAHPTYGLEEVERDLSD